MSNRLRLTIAGVAALVLIAGIAVAVVANNDDDEPGVALRSDAPASTTTTEETTTTTVAEETTTTTEAIVPTTTTSALANATTTVPRPTTTAAPATTVPAANDVSQRGVYVVTLDGTLRRLADATQIGLDVAPDGRRIAFLDDHKLFVVNSDGSGGRRELAGVGRAINKWDNPAWSPDGRSVAAIRLDPDGGYRVSVAEVDTNPTRVRRIGQEVAAAHAIEWTPDSTAVVISSGTALWRAPLDGSAATKLADTGQYGPAGYVAFSPDGTKLAYAVYDALVVTAPDGSNPKTVAKVPFGGRFAWSPDSTRLAHALRVGERTGIAVTAADGSSTKTVVDAGAIPSWTRSGTIAFTNFEGVGTGAPIELIEPDGSNRRRLVADTAPAKLREDHTWGPGGQFLAFTSGTGGDGT